jgi:hypothetical protein
LRTPSHRHFFSPGSSILLCLAKHLLAAQARAVPDIKLRRGLSGTRGVLRDTLQPNDSIDVLFFPTRAEWPLTFNSCAESTLGCGMLSLARSSGLEPLTAHCHGDRIQPGRSLKNGQGFQEMGAESICDPTIFVCVMLTCFYLEDLSSIHCCC